MNTPEQLAEAYKCAEHTCPSYPDCDCYEVLAAHSRALEADLETLRLERNMRVMEKVAAEARIKELEASYEEARHEWGMAEDRSAFMEKQRDEWQGLLIESEARAARMREALEFVAAEVKFLLANPRTDKAVEVFMSGAVETVIGPALLPSPEVAEAVYKGVNTNSTTTGAERVNTNAVAEESDREVERDMSKIGLVPDNAEEAGKPWPACPECGQKHDPRHHTRLWDKPTPVADAAPEKKEGA